MDIEGQTLQDYIRSSNRQMVATGSEITSTNSMKVDSDDDCTGMSLERYMWTGTPKNDSSLSNSNTSAVRFPPKKVPLPIPRIIPRDFNVNLGATNKRRNSK